MSSPGLYVADILRIFPPLPVIPANASLGMSMSIRTADAHNLIFPCEDARLYLQIRCKTCYLVATWRSSAFTLPPRHGSTQPEDAEPEVEALAEMGKKYPQHAVGAKDLRELDDGTGEAVDRAMNFNDKPILHESFFYL
jgi:hypothetical protein